MTAPDHDPLDAIERALQSIQIKHFEMAGMVEDYRALIEELRGAGAHSQEHERLASVLPGARYHVSSTYVSQTWQQIEGELKRAFPEAPGT